ncbi:MAG: beta-phosphoglucomutase family hydrolase [Desulfuromonadales bacterium]|nr:beta-phosphoglucomutase family hydrolase [Desulfuromonadales bacterium]
MTGRLHEFAAVLFDLDGVLTMTMPIHARCWKTMFDAYLQERAARLGGDWRPFSIDNDYLVHVDGKLRQDGVRAFLASRGIEIAEGRPEDGPERETVYGLGNRKDRLFGELLARDGVEILAGSLQLLHRVRDWGLKTAVVSASKNCRRILQSAGIEPLFDTVVDGLVAARLGLPGKPDPATYLEAARQLGVTAAAAVVIEDAVAGVEAGRAGQFGLIIGIDHHGDPQTLRQHGADIVVTDLAELF